MGANFDVSDIQLTYAEIAVADPWTAAKLDRTDSTHEEVPCERMDPPRPGPDRLSG